MRLIVNVARWFDWVSEPTQPSDEDIAKRVVKPDAAGRWMRRIVIDTPSHTEVTLPESELADCQAHFERVEMPKDRGEVAAWYLADKVMPAQAPRDAWLSIEVHGEPEVEAYLNAVFKLTPVGGAQ